MAFWSCPKVLAKVTGQFETLDYKVLLYTTEDLRACFCEICFPKKLGENCIRMGFFGKINGQHS